MNCKFFILPLLVLHISLVFGQNVEVPRSSPKAEVIQFIGVNRIAIDYSRPSVRGREVFGALVPYGKVWRAGANEATTIALQYDAKIGGFPVPAGKYSIFLVPKKEDWELIINKEWNQWGAYNYSSEKDLFRVEVPVSTVPHQEQLVFDFVAVKRASGWLKLRWATSQVEVLIETNTEQDAKTSIEDATEKVDGYWFTYSASAQYYFYDLKDSKKALFYINKAIGMDPPNPAPWMLKSQILATMKQFKEAVEQAELAIEVCKRTQHEFEIEENLENIKKWSGHK